MKRKFRAIWVLVNCNSFDEAKNIGEKALKKRLTSCFDIFDRKLSTYFWPPKTNTFESANGCLLISESLEEKYEKLADFVEKLHSDEEPFIGYIHIHGLKKSFLDWIKGEVR